MLRPVQTPLHPQKRGISLLFLLFTWLFSLGIPSVYGQNDGLVFGPEVIAGETLIDARIAYDADGERWVYRNHIQHSFSKSFNLRGIAQYRIDSSNRWDFRYFRVEGLWQFLEDEKAGWDSALRFELEIAEGDDLPSRVRLAWAGSYDIDDNWQVRGNFLTGYQIGPASDPGALVEVRGQISRKLFETSRLAFDYFGNMNTTETFGGWETQRHQIGPTVSFQLNKNISIIAGALFGISLSAPDTEFRVITNYLF